MSKDNIIFKYLHVTFGVSMQACGWGDIFLVYYWKNDWQLGFPHKTASKNIKHRTTTNEAQCTITLSKIFYV